jgi:hypothetical protein
MMMLAGCSELQVIGKATIREFAADSISVDSERYKPRPSKKRTIETRTLVAKANIVDGKLESPQRKELWRNN